MSMKKCFFLLDSLTAHRPDDILPSAGRAVVSLPDLVGKEALMSDFELLMVLLTAGLLIVAIIGLRNK